MRGTPSSPSSLARARSANRGDEDSAARRGWPLKIHQRVLPAEASEVLAWGAKNDDFEFASQELTRVFDDDHRPPVDRRSARLTPHTAPKSRACNHSRPRRGMNDA